MLLNQYPIRSRSLVKNDISANETASESATTDQDTTESDEVGEVTEQQEAEHTEESEKETEIVQEAQEKIENGQESGVTPDSTASDRQPESEDRQENVVQDAQIQNTEESEEQDAERSENVKEVIKEIFLMNQQESETQVIQTVNESEYNNISTDDYRIISILLLAAILGAVVATAFLGVINRGL